MERYDDEHLLKLQATHELDMEELERLVGRICSNIHAATLNALRLNGNQNVKDEHYRDEERYMPNRGRRPKMPRVQSWDEMKGNLGY